jgi:hypothetical protein
MAVDSLPAATAAPFHEWKRATAALRIAEARCAPYAELVRLSEDVIRTRNLLTADWLEAGLALRDCELRQFEADECLLSERDDTAQPVL